MGPQQFIMDPLLRYPQFIAYSHPLGTVARPLLMFHLTPAAEMGQEMETQVKVGGP
jgi:hypothetical protein